jgi:hypothetical protein
MLLEGLVAPDRLDGGRQPELVLDALALVLLERLVLLEQPLGLVGVERRIGGESCGARVRLLGVLGGRLEVLRGGSLGWSSGGLLRRGCRGRARRGGGRGDERPHPVGPDVVLAARDLLDAVGEAPGLVRA